MSFIKNNEFHDPWVGTDTPGPGEAVFAIRFNGQISNGIEHFKFQNPTQIRKNKNKTY